MRVLITGATGLVGQELVKVLHQKNYKVNYLTTRKNKIVNSDNYQGFFWNPSKGEIDNACFDEVFAIINLAGSSIAKRWTSSYKKEVINSRVDSINTLKLGLQRLDKKIDCILGASAIGIYPSSESTFYDETNQGVDQSFLGEVVEQWEQATDDLAAFTNYLSKIRIGLVLSKNGGALPKMTTPIKNLVGAPLGKGTQWQSWIHINDLARLFVHIMETKSQGVFNGVAPNPVTNKKLTKEIATLLKRPLVLPNVPAFVLKLVFGEMAYVLLASQRVCSKKVEEHGFAFKYANINAALASIFHAKPAPMNLVEA